MTEPSQWFVLLKTLFSLGLVIALIYALSWTAKKYLRPERWSTGGGSEIKVLQSFSLDPKKKLMIVEVRDEQLLLGVTEQSISMLSSLNSTKEAKAL
jgi:flagellar protein FliO/FliZ